MLCEGKPSGLSMCVLGTRRTIPRQCPQLNCMGRLAKAVHLAWVDLQHSTGISEWQTDFLNYGFEVWLTTSQGLPCSCSVLSKINWFIRNMGWYNWYMHICYISVAVCCSLYPQLSYEIFFDQPFFFVIILYFLGVFVFLIFVLFFVFCPCYSVIMTLPQAQAYMPACIDQWESSDPLTVAPNYPRSITPLTIFM